MIPENKKKHILDCKLWLFSILHNSEKKLYLCFININDTSNVLKFCWKMWMKYMLHQISHKPHPAVNVKNALEIRYVIIFQNSFSLRGGHRKDSIFKLVSFINCWQMLKQYQETRIIWSWTKIKRSVIEGSVGQNLLLNSALYNLPKDTRHKCKMSTN